jgi:Asp-tRNA(Asn)/Glu-tRNA(Gln) amidotransferase C subunit
MLSNKQIEEILAKKPEKRYNYFIKTVCAEEEVWGLIDDEGWLLLEVEGEENDAIAVFPNQEFAQMFREHDEEYADFAVEAMDLYEFVDWLEDFEVDNIKVAVFPTTNMQSAVMSPERIRDDIQVEFDKEEGE